MIFGFLWTAVATFMAAVVDVVNTALGTLPAAGTLDMVSISGAIGLMRTVDSILPVHEVLPLLVASIGVQLAVFLFRLALTIYQAIPGKFT